MSWVSDAQFLTKLRDEDLVKTPRIRVFLEKNNFSKICLIASKGMGKTLLMRHKRKEIENSYNKEGVFIIPKDSESDYVDLPTSRTDMLLTEMKKTIFWDKIWQISIMISCLLNFRYHNTSNFKNDIYIGDIDETHLPKRIKEQIKRSISGIVHLEFSPSNVLTEVLKLTKKDVELVISEDFHIVREIYSDYISSGCFVFIDSFDQALNDYNDLDIWRSAQCGLLKASWELSRHNYHVKVFTTIRQEAWASFNDPVKQNIRGSTLLIEYTKSDLEKIFLSLIKANTSCESIDSFIGLNRVKNSYIGVEEDNFDYIYRHILPIPRWLAKLGGEIEFIRQNKGLIGDDSEKVEINNLLTEVVNRYSSTLAIDHFITDILSLFKDINPNKFLKTLSLKIKSSILSKNQVHKISDELADEFGYSHPFCLLYNLGLIGVVQRNAGSANRVQSFRRPYEFDWDRENILPNTDAKQIYMLHPCIQDYFQKSNTLFKPYRIIISDGSLWTLEQDTELFNQTLRIFISYSTKDQDIVINICRLLENFFDSRGIISDIWLDEWKLKSGRWVQDQLYEGITKSDFLIIVLSENSIKSNAVQTEWKTKFQEKINLGLDTVLPIVIDKIKHDEIPSFLKNIFYRRYEDNNIETINKFGNDIVDLHEEVLKNS